MDRNDKSKDILMKELLEVKLSLQHEDVTLTTELLDDKDIFSLVKVQLQKKISKPSYETW
ncbi:MULTISPECIES: hypothetical protein [Peribacillus]|uniref:hypothetical protein n=1 Tax=Peribacillus TaxID=2675229 RepID=UPI0033353930